jgi:hypothetical protein
MTYKIQQKWWIDLYIGIGLLELPVLYEQYLQWQVYQAEAEFIEKSAALDIHFLPKIISYWVYLKKREDVYLGIVFDYFRFWNCKIIKTVSNFTKIRKYGWWKNRRWLNLLRKKSILCFVFSFISSDQYFQIPFMHSVLDAENCTCLSHFSIT